MKKLIIKTLIWFSAIFVASAISTVCIMGNIQLGAIPIMILYGGAIWIAKKLCAKPFSGDNNAADKDENEATKLPEIKSEFIENTDIKLTPDLEKKAQNRKLLIELIVIILIYLCICFVIDFTPIN